MGLSGKADVVEFHPDGRILPVEYKRGRPKSRNMDEVQVCAQAMCIEEMRGVSIGEGAIFYGKKRRRKTLVLDEALRRQTEAAAARVHELVEKGLTPPPVVTDGCGRCSLQQLCMPEVVTKNRDVGRYLSRMLAKELGPD